jgi:hypothetical protein
VNILFFCSELHVLLTATILANASRVMSNNTNNAPNTARSRNQLLRETVTVVAVPSVAIENDRLQVGSSQSSTLPISLHLTAQY